MLNQRKEFDPITTNSFPMRTSYSVNKSFLKEFLFSMMVVVVMVVRALKRGVAAKERKHGGSS